ncbi:MAG: hypothetical protein SWX82_07130 [Cyanobacteriota bacterium]|nr:hypothetical protein [Cyanobacteriota bacterium]
MATDIQISQPLSVYPCHNHCLASVGSQKLMPPLLSPIARPEFGYRYTD